MIADVNLTENWMADFEFGNTFYKLGFLSLNWSLFDELIRRKTITLLSFRWESQITKTKSANMIHQINNFRHSFKSDDDFPKTPQSSCKLFCKLFIKPHYFILFMHKGQQPCHKLELLRKSKHLDSWHLKIADKYITNYEFSYILNG